MWIKMILGTFFVLLWVGLAIGCWQKCGVAQVPKRQESTQPFVCSLSPAELDSRLVRLRSFTAKSREVRELANGLALQFAFDELLVEEAARLIEEETRCCSFLEFRLTVQPAKDLLAVEITGPAGTREFLAASTAFAMATATGAAPPEAPTADVGCGCFDACSSDGCATLQATQ